MPRPYVAATRVFGSPGFSEIWYTATDGRSLPSGAYLPPFVPFEANTPTAVATISCLPRTSDQVAWTLGRLPEMSLNDSPASVDLYTCPPPELEASSPSEPIGAK